MLYSCNNSSKESETKMANPPSVSVIITDSTYIAPDTLPVGLVTIELTNKASEMHSAHLIKLDDGYTTDQLLSAYADSMRRGSNRPNWMTHIGGVIGENEKSAITLNLESGNYTWVCVMGSDNTPHFAGHEHQEVVVSGEVDPNVVLSDPQVEIDMTDENFIIHHNITAGPNSIQIKNTGTKHHLAAISKLNEGAKKQDVMNWFSNYNGPPPATGIIATSAIGPNLSARLQIDFEPGEYVLFCMANAEGSYHLFDGAITSFSVE